jgi:radical SAM protein with 4Fe4S-binding SPASM domain
MEGTPVRLVGRLGDVTGSTQAEPTCAAPSSSMYLDQRGNVRACCQNARFTLGNVTRQTLREIWDGERSQRLRAAVAAGDLSLGCEFCRWRSADGADQAVFARTFDHLRPVASAPEWPRQLELSLSNACNLQCVMCNGEWSSAIRAHREGLPPMPTVYDDAFFDGLAAFLPHLQVVKLLGGEPFLGRESLRVLEMLAETGSDAEVHITTNGTQWSPRIERILDRLRVYLVVSIDAATAPTYESIRVGASFDRVMANLDRFMESVDRRGTKVSLTHCLMSNNWHEFHQLLQLGEDRGLDIYVNAVTQPYGVSLYHLPPAELREVVGTLRSRHEWVGARITGQRLDVWNEQLGLLEQHLEQMERQELPDYVARRREQGFEWLGPPERARTAGAELARLAAADDVWMLDVEMDGTIAAFSRPEPTSEVALDTWLEGRILVGGRLPGVLMNTSAGPAAEHPDDLQVYAATLDPATELVAGVARAAVRDADGVLTAVRMAVSPRPLAPDAGAASGPSAAREAAVAAVGSDADLDGLVVGGDGRIVRFMRAPGAFFSTDVAHLEGASAYELFAAIGDVLGEPQGVPVLLTDTDPPVDHYLLEVRSEGGRVGEVHAFAERVGDTYEVWVAVPSSGGGAPPQHDDPSPRDPVRSSGSQVDWNGRSAGGAMAGTESLVGGPDRGSSSCARLLVVDPAGLLEAPLDGVDVEPVDVPALVASLASSTTDAPLGAIVGHTGAPAGAADGIRPVHPSVLRQQGAHVVAWDDATDSYVVLPVAALAVLDLARHPMDVPQLLHDLDASEWEVSDEEIRAALGQLAAASLIELERRPEQVDRVPEAEAQVDHPESAPDVPDEVGQPIGDGAVADDAGSPSSFQVELAAPEPAPEALPSIFADLPSGAPAARVLAYRIVGRSRRRARRAWIATGRAGARRLSAHFGDERDDWAASPEVEVETPESAAETAESAAETPASAAETSGEAVEPAAVEHADAAVVDLDPVQADADDVCTAGDDIDEGPSAADGSPLGDEPAVALEPTPVHDHRTPVFGVYYSPEHNANLGLGMIIAHARVVDRGALNNVFDLRRASIDAAPMLAELERTGRPSIVLCSDYMWSIDHNLAVSERVKQLSPRSLVVHGGPHAPKYEADAERFLDEHPYVDVLVRGEGELTIAALLGAVGPDPDPERLGEVLGEVEGLTFRSGPHGEHTVVRTPDRARPAEMDQFPSPYLTGEFDEIDTTRWRSATVETNRGCPYGCTFCDWGTATNSRIRQFARDRVFAELEWLASRGISEIFLADANFGLYARDVEVAQHIAELKQEYGAPSQVICSFAKNTVKYTSEIVRIWVEAGICAEGSVALQTTDEVTLANVERSNIKVEKYDALADEFRRHRLPIVTDLLMGLPGATVESFKNDLQRCLDQEVTPRMMETVLLPNSPMNAPEYRERFQIETDEANVLVATSSYTRDDFEEMKRLRLLFRACEHYGLLRHLFRWLQVEKGVRALDLLHDIDRAIVEDPGRYPLLTWVGRYFDLITAPPGGWPPFYDEVAQLLDERHGIVRDEAMETVLAVQKFLMPAHHRRFPARLDLPHDYVAWYQATSEGAGVRPLVEMPPGELIVDDPAGVCDARLLRNGFSIRREEACDNPFWVLNDWELDSALARPMATAVPQTAAQVAPGPPDAPGAPTSHEPSDAPGLLPVGELRRYSRQLLADPALQEQMRRAGFVVVHDVFQASELDALRQLASEFESVYGDLGEEFLTLGRVEDPELRTEFIGRAGQVALPRLAELFVEQAELLGSVFQIKPPSPRSALNSHQDDSLVDEREWLGVYAWVPLDDTDAENGGLCVLPGSHRLPNWQRTLNIPWQFESYREILESHAVPLEVPAGSVVLFDSATVHSSPPNSSGRARWALNSFARDRAAPLLQFFKDDSTPDGCVEAYEVDVGYFLSADIRARPTPPHRYVGLVDQHRVQRSSEEFAALILTAIRDAGSPADQDRAPDTLAVGG